MNILCTACPSRKGYAGFQPQQNFSSAELTCLCDSSEDYLPDDDTPEACSDLDGQLLPATADEPLLDLDPRGAVEAWRIAALGRRPRDFLGRDLLLNSLWRDERPRVFHSLAKKPPAWIEDHVRHLPGTQDRQAAQLTVLHYLHRRQLARLWSGEVAADMTEDEDRHLVTRLWNCWPYGAKMAAPGPAQAAPHRCWCRLAWLCPWCYARRAVGLERLLREGPLQEPQGKHLVLAWLPTFGEQTSPDPDWDDRWCGRPGYYLQGPKKVRRMRSAITAKLRQYARALGITGGIITHQISPWKTGYSRKGVAPGLASFHHDFALLGEVTFPDEDHADRFRDQTAYRTYPYRSMRITHPDLPDGSMSPSIFWSFHAADDEKLDALRLFLAGSSADYPVRRLDWHAGGLTEGPLARNGIRGALALQPHFMMDEVQWWSYAEATRGLPLYVPFGTWRSAIGEAKCKRAEHRKAAILLPSPQRKAASRRREGLKKANLQRRRVSQQALDKLVEVARPLLKEAMAEVSGRRGRPAHRARLKELLEQQGYAVSEHLLKQLVKKLGS